MRFAEFWWQVIERVPCRAAELSLLGRCHDGVVWQLDMDGVAVGSNIVECQVRMAEIFFTKMCGGSRVKDKGFMVQCWIFGDWRWLGWYSFQDTLIYFIVEFCCMPGLSGPLFAGFFRATLAVIESCFLVVLLSRPGACCACVAQVPGDAMCVAVRDRIVVGVIALANWSCATIGAWDLAVWLSFEL